MAEINRVTLFGKLNGLGYDAIESGTIFCKMRGNPYVELVHWVQQIQQLQDSDLHRIESAFNVDPARLARDITASLDRLPRGATSISDLSTHLEEAVERGWVYATLLFSDNRIRTGYLVVGILKTPALRHALMDISGEFSKIRVDELTDRFEEITRGSPEEGLPAADGSSPSTTAPPEARETPPAAMGKQKALRRFSVDLTEKARNGELDPIVGRDPEIRKLIDVLMRRRQNNPILTGDAGVGKTAIAEGLALRIASGDVPLPLRNVSLRTLDVGLLQAGASVKGEFEDRLRQVIEEVQSSTQPIILFIDEAHTLIGAGGAKGTGDAANLLKPALARGTLRTIAATTWGEYREHIEPDPALTRRFQVVGVNEPDEEQATLMMRAVSGVLEKHHRVHILDEALSASVTLSRRYIPARQLPDKSVSLLDTAAARVAIGLETTPPEVDDCRRKIEALRTELEIISREKAMGIDIGEREDRAQKSLEIEENRLSELEGRWNEERSLVDEINRIRTRLCGEPGVGGDDGKDSRKSEPGVEGETAEGSAEEGSAVDDEAERKELTDKLDELTVRLHRLQGDSPMVLPNVDSQAVASVVANWTGIPVARMVRDEIENVLDLADALNERVLGQRHALEAIARAILTSRAGLSNPGKPIGVFLLCGPSGVGKTEVGLTLAERLYGGEDKITTINMSEYTERHTVSNLKGAPPGYVGYGKGGVLTEAVRRKPYSVVLLDEMEKAHPDVHEMFFQVFDKGMMEDSEGRFIDFKNTIVIMTCNVGSDLIMKMCSDPDLKPDPEGLNKALRQPLLESFPAALIGRLTVIPFYPLDEAILRDIAKLQLDRVARRTLETHGSDMDYSAGVLDLIVERCTEVESGGRMIEAILNKTLLPTLSRAFLKSMLDKKPIKRVGISVEDGDFVFSYS